MIQFAWPLVFLLLPLPWLIRRFLPPAPNRGGAPLRVPFYQDVVALQPGYHAKRTVSWRRLSLPALAWTLLVLAAARPQWLGDPVALPLSGRDLMLAIDISGSMEIPDFALDGREVTRLEVVKTAANDFIARRVGDHIGLVLFGTRAYLRAPLTFDRDTVRAMLSDASIGLAGKDTAIGDAIGLAVKRLRERPDQQRVLILLTDGANTAGEVDPIKAAELAAQQDLRIYTIGIGADQMRVSVPTLLGTQVVNPSRDLDESSLKKIAELTDGAYFRAKDSDGLEEIYRQLDELEPQESESEFFRPQRTLYPWPLAGALLLSALIVIRENPSLKRVGRRPFSPSSTNDQEVKKAA